MRHGEVALPLGVGRVARGEAFADGEAVGEAPQRAGQVALRHGQVPELFLRDGEVALPRGVGRVARGEVGEHAVDGGDESGGGGEGAVGDEFVGKEDSGVGEVMGGGFFQAVGQGEDEGVEFPVGGGGLVAVDGVGALGEVGVEGSCRPFRA